MLNNTKQRTKQRTTHWKKHIEHVTSKAAKRLYFLKVLKRSGLSHEHLLHYYIAVI